MGDEKENDDKKGVFLPFNTITISGGAFKGIILLGCIQAIYDKNLHHDISCFVGTSSGAMIGYLLAIGYTPVEILGWLCARLKLDDIHINLVNMLNGHGATSYMIIQEHLEKMTIEKIGFLPTLADIKTKFGKIVAMPTWNYTRKKCEVLSYKTTPELPALVSLRMTANLPLIFDYFKYNNSYYVDGGVVNNFPIDIAEEYGTNILGIFAQSKDEKETNDIPKNMLEYIYQLAMIPVQDSIERKIEHCISNPTIVRILHESSNFHFPVNTKEKMEMFDHGYTKMIEFLNKEQNPLL